MFRRLVPMLMAGYVLWQWSSWVRARRARDAAPPVEETTWEGEGGALPGTGSQLGPEPSAR
jgi:hypothetical protein